MPSPAKDEAEEVSELLALFGHQTDVPRGMLLKFQVSKANREKADAERKAKEERQKLLEERMAEQHERIQKLRSATKDLDREATARLKAANRKNASRIKAEEKEWENLRQLKHNAMVKDVHARGSADFHNARIGEIEAKMLKDRRDKQQKEKAAEQQKRVAEERAQKIERIDTLVRQARTEIRRKEPKKALATVKEILLLEYLQVPRARTQQS
jgi:chromosome segregation ATPase